MRTRFAVFAAVAMLALGNSAHAQQQIPQLKEPNSAQVTIFRALRNLPYIQHFGIGCRDLRFTGKTLEFDSIQEKRKGQPETIHHAIDMTTLATVKTSWQVKRTGIVTYKAIYEVTVGGQKPSPDVALLFGRFLDSQHKEEIDGDFIAAILNRLHEYSLQPEQPLLDFPRAAAAWRTLPQRPPASDVVRVPRLMAEDAIKANQPYMALYYYETGLEKDPYWAIGYFNAAMVAGSVQAYAAAAEHMERYLLLMPDAPDAQAARDQADIWKIKMRESH